MAREIMDKMYKLQTRGFAPGWYENALSALLRLPWARSRRAEGPIYTTLAQRAMFQKAA